MFSQIRKEQTFDFRVI